MKSNMQTMQARYERAAALTAEQNAMRTPGLGIEGYWLNDTLYFFLAEAFEPSIGQVVGTPAIVDSQTHQVQTVVSLPALAELLSTHSAQPIDLKALASARFDMPNPQLLAISVQDHDFLVDPTQRRVLQVLDAQAPALYSPDGRYACLVRGNDLWLKERASGSERPMTRDGTPHHCYGQRAESGLRAITYRRKPIPLGLWSPDSQWFLTHRIDERAVPDLSLLEYAPPGGGRPVLHTFKSPMPGDSLPVATYLAIHVASGRIVTFDGFPTPLVAPYTPFTQNVWFAGSDTAWLLRFNRHSTQVELIRLELASGTGCAVISETAASGYLDLHPLNSTPNVRILPQSSEVIWFSEADGWGHLYLYDSRTGALKNQITRGQFLVRDILHVDEQRREILFLAGGLDPETDPARRALCSVNFDGSHFAVLLSHDGDVFVPRTELADLFQNRPFRPAGVPVAISPTGARGIVQYLSVDRGNRTEMVEFRAQRRLTLAAVTPDADEALVRHFTALAADGETRLHGVLFLPSDLDESRRYPLIDFIYPGPQITQQPQSFRSMSAAQARVLAELGFAVMMLDTRGMPVAGRALHQLGYGELLEPQLSDHAAVVRQLCQRYIFLDGERIGMMGSSGGGTATARALFDYGHLFKVGVSICGNHDSTFYSASWSNKYRGPGSREVWDAQANGAAAHKLQGRLLLMSGDMDENVNVSHTLALADALIQANKDFDLLIIPNENHGVHVTSGYAQRRIWDYFVRHLLGVTPPRDFELKFQPHELARMWTVWGRQPL